MEISQAKIRKIISLLSGEYFPEVEVGITKILTDNYEYVYKIQPTLYMVTEWKNKYHPEWRLCGTYDLINIEVEFRRKYWALGRKIKDTLGHMINLDISPGIYQRKNLHYEVI